MKLAPLALLIGSLAQATLALDGAPRATSCLLAPDKDTPIRPAAGRVVHCALDLGSKNVKLSVVSMEPGRNTSIRDERQCKRPLGFGTLVYDSKTRTAKPLPQVSIDLLVETIGEFQRLCKLDGGTLLVAAATQWARDATNAAGVRAKVLARTGVDMEILTPKREADYGYLAASLGAPGRIVLDPGSNSFQISWQPKRSRAVSGVTIGYGYVRASAGDFETAPDYATARRSYVEKVRGLINGDLAKLSPALDLAGLRALVKAGELEPEILAFGQDGAVAALSVRGVLRDASGNWLADPKAYDGVVARQPLHADARFGFMIGQPITPAELGRFLDGIRAADFKTLTTDPARDLYGQRALVLPVLVDLLFKELGAASLVMLPQEISTGYILAKTAR